MASVIIASFFTRNDVPATDIDTVSGGTYPILRAWEVTDGTAPGDAFIGPFVMIPVEDGSNDDGFYKYEFTDTPDGFDPTMTYLFRVDGGPSIPNAERYQVEQYDPSKNVEQIVDNVWNEPTIDHVSTGTTGLALSQIKADTTAIANNLYLNTDSVLDMIELSLKLEAGRTKIDPTAKTLTIYDEDCTTPLRVYELFDSTGTPSVTDVCERVPVTKGAGDTSNVTDVCP